MPRVDFRNAAPWLDLYSDYAGGHLVWTAEHWRRFAHGPVRVNGVDQEPHPLAPLPADRILVVASGAGGMVKAAHDDGFPNVWGLDYALTTLEAIGVTVPPGVTVVEIDAGAPAGQIRQALRTGTGDDEFDWVITDNMISCYDPGAELDGILGAGEAVLSAGLPNSRLVHVITTIDPNIDQDPALFWQTIDEWNSIRPGNTWITTTGWEIR